MTDKQLQAMNFIRSYIEKNGISPSYREIVDNTLLYGAGNVRAILTRLQDANLITFELRKSRSIKLVPGINRDIANVLDKFDRNEIMAFEAIECIRTITIVAKAVA